MNVRELIKELRKIEDKKLLVMVAAHDHGKGEYAGSADSVFIEDEIDLETREQTSKRVVVIHG